MRVRPRDQVARVSRPRSWLRTLRPRAGALANARDAVREDQCCAQHRRAAALEQVRAQGTRNWAPLHQAPAPGHSRAGHAVHFPANDGELVAQLAFFVAEGLDRDEVCVVIATARHREGMHQSLAAHGLRPERADRIVEFDADDTLEQLMCGENLDPIRFDEFAASTMARLDPEASGVRAFGEMVSLLHQQGNLGAALHLESHWQKVQSRLGFPLLCAYLNSTVDPGSGQFVGQVCASHTHLVRSTS